ncbi:MAG: hypothetical protein U0744_17290 [Gemmataceae bacterium]
MEWPGTGTPVVLSGQPKGDEHWRGVVCERNRSEIHVALGEPLDDEGRPSLFRLDLSPDEKTRQRQLARWSEPRTAEKDRLAELRRVLLGNGSGIPRCNRVEAADASLNGRNAGRFRCALRERDVAILHGPPGQEKPPPSSS